MEKVELKPEVEIDPKKIKEPGDVSKISKKVLSSYIDIGNTSLENPWTSKEIDKLETYDLKEDYNKAVKACRFFYKRDPIASKVIDKLIDISMTGIRFSQGNLTDNQLNVFKSIQGELEEFLEECALEYLISGMVLPEIRYGGTTKKELMEMGIKTYGSLTLPKSFWIRDITTILIKDSLLGNRPSYFVQVPENTRHFIQHEGTYEGGAKDKELYLELIKLYPEFVEQVRNGEKYVLIENPIVIRGKYLADSPYPIPFLYPALESLKHKRNLRRMDYSISSRVISAILLFRLGDKDFPLTEDAEDQLTDLKEEVKWRNTGGRNLDRIYQLFANHTLQIDWIFPPVDALLDEKKYIDVNADIFYALGFPKILLTGEAQRTGTSDAEAAILSPVKTMEVLRRKMLPIAKMVMESVVEQNPQLKQVPVVTFEPMDLTKFSDFLEGLQALYETRNLSRTSYAARFGYILEDEWKKIKEEDSLMKQMNIQEFAPVPYSNSPNTGTDTNNVSNNEDNTDLNIGENDEKR